MRRALILVGFVVLPGCTVPVLIPVSGPDPNVAFPTKTDSLGAAHRAIEGYYTRSGAFVAVDGFVEVAGDSIRFVVPAKPGRGLELPQPEIVQVVPRDSVAAVKGVQTDVPRSIVLAVGVTALFLAAIALAELHSWSQEPLL